MAKKKSYKVSYKSMNGQLSKTKKELEKIKKDLSDEDKKDIDLQVEAMNLLLKKCRTRMTHIYFAKMTHNCPTVLTQAEARRL